MVGGDVAVLYMDEFLGHVEDFNLTAKWVCFYYCFVDTRVIVFLYQMDLKN